jgi:hypothetical protein
LTVSTPAIVDHHIADAAVGHAAALGQVERLLTVAATGQLRHET